MVKNLTTNAGDAGDLDSIPESGRSPEGGSGNPSSIFAWEIPWTEEPAVRGVTKSQIMLSD